MTGMAGMAEWQKEWLNGKMAEMDTYVLFMVHADTDDDDNNDNDTLIFYIIESLQALPALTLTKSAIGAGVDRQ